MRQLKLSFVHLLLIAVSYSTFIFVLAEEPASQTENAELQIGALKVGKVLFLGNSITLHGPAPQIGWEGNWGMAASAQDKDFVHLLLAEMTRAAGKAPQAKIKNIADFERNYTEYNLQEALKDELAFETDLIVLAIGENVAALSTEESQQQFAKAIEALLHELKQHGSPTIFVRSTFWADPVKDGILKQACEKAGGTFVDNSHLGENAKNFARSERKIEHAGVAGHPGDAGMQAIATSLWKAIEKKAAPLYCPTR